MLRMGLDSGVAESIDVVYLVNTMEILEIICFAHVNARGKTVPFTGSHFNTHF